MNICHYQLDIDIKNALKKDWKFPFSFSKHEIWNFQVDDILDSVWIEKFNKTIVEIKNIMLFYRATNINCLEAHIDSYFLPNGEMKFWNSAFNWTLGGKDSKMFWYKNHSNVDYKKDLRWTPAKTPYLSWPTDNLEKIDECHIGNNLTLVRTSVPHRVEINIEPRWCISMRPCKNFTWEELVSLLENKNLIKKTYIGN